MTEINRAAVVTYTAEQMYLLVNDIESYPEFLPWCVDAKIIERQKHMLRATLSMAASKIKQSFTTKNTMQYGSRIDIQLLHGPFKYLSGHWNFNASNDGGCHVQLYIHYEFENKFMQYVLGGLLYKLLDTMVCAFVKRADNVYGSA